MHGAQSAEFIPWRKMFLITASTGKVNTVVDIWRMLPGFG